MTLNDMIFFENNIIFWIGNTVTEIESEIEKASFPGVQKLPGGYVSVSLSQLRQERMIMSPGCYIPGLQAKAVASFLSKATTAHELVKKIQELVEEKKVRYQNEKMPLNPVTVNILRSYC